MKNILVVVVKLYHLEINNTIIVFPVDLPRNLKGVRFLFLEDSSERGKTFTRGKHDAELRKEK